MLGCFKDIPPERAGFSLVELSIVLVILGLLTGGILGGQSLIKAAELRSVTTEYEQWQTAMNTFHDKYFTLPGDMGNASDFWGAGTDDGDGDGRIISAENAGEYGEMFLFWQHMALAGLISGEYTGQAGPDDYTYTGSEGRGGSHAVIGENVPVSKYAGAGWSVISEDWSTGSSTSRFGYDYRNALAFGSTTAHSGVPSNSTGYTIRPVLTPEDAWNIDTKYDDGKPGRGKVIAYPYDICANGTGTFEFDVEYQLPEESVTCALYFR